MHILTFYFANVYLFVKVAIKTYECVNNFNRKHFLKLLQRIYVQFFLC